jgi:hypothetical protein
VSDAETHAQLARIIALLQQRPDRRGPESELARKARRASKVLDRLATLVLVAGGVFACFGLLAMGEVGFVYGLVLIAATAVSSALYWGILTTASVVAEHVAERSHQ